MIEAGAETFGVRTNVRPAGRGGKAASPCNCGGFQSRKGCQVVRPNVVILRTGVYRNVLIRELSDTSADAGRLDSGDRANFGAEDPSIAGILRLVGSGSGGEVLMALGPRPLRTEQLARRLMHVSERSVYRYSAELTKRELIKRFEVAGVPSTVILSLTDPPGRHLYRLLRRFATTSLARLPAPGVQIQSWSSLNLLSQLWASGFLEKLSNEPQTLTELSGGPHGLTFHQVTRRMRLFTDSGLLIACRPTGNSRHYELSEHGRRRMALIAGLGRWRDRYVITGEATGLTGAEMATLLRAALPLILLPGYAGMRLNLGVASPMDKYGHRTVEALRGVVGKDGLIRSDQSLETSVDGSAAGTMNTWLSALLDGNRGRMRSGGNLPLIDACLIQLNKVLWEIDAMPASIGAGGD
jgi:DNA-binding HxlR family transcriptional regulator